MKKIIILIAYLLIINPAFAQSEVFDANQLQNEVKEGIQKAYAASVRIVKLDSNQKGVGGFFSGVVVDGDGHILSAAHAVNPNYTYLVTFPDGRQCKAKGLGVIHSIDAAMMVITDKGKWPFVKMGWSSVLEPNVPALSISYPGSLIFNKPTIRFGYVAELKHQSGFMRSTCLMEPGDSGGALFDLKGRLIGIHSRVSIYLDENMEVPVDNFRKYWSALKTPAVHTAFIQEDKIKTPKKDELVKPVPQIAKLISEFKVQDSTFRKNVFTVIDSSNVSILATLVNLSGLIPQSNLTGKSYFISKSSMVGASPKIEMMDGQMMSAKVISRYNENDLVLLQIPQEISGGVKLDPSYRQDDKIGSFLISPKPKAVGEMSVLGNMNVTIPKSPETYLGIATNFNQDDRKIVVTDLFPLASEKASSKPNDIAVRDVLLKINDRLILTVADLPEELSKYNTNQTVTIQYAKKTGVYTQTFTLKPRFTLSTTAKDLFMDGKSKRRDNFKDVLVHDGRLTPSTCGGPLFDVKGNFYGINIARLSRTSSLTIPTPVLIQFIKGVTAF